MTLNKKNPQAGQAMLTAVIFFLFIASAIVLGIASPVLKQARISNDLIKSKESYYLASGGLEDALYRVKNARTINSGDTIVLNGYTTTLALTTTATGKTLEATSNRAGIIRKMQAKVTTGVGVAFNYGVQAGNGGFQLSGGSQINGSVYANGDIVATNGVTITGTAIAANSSALVSDQSNTSSLPSATGSCTSSTCITFGNSSGTQDVAQSFKVSTTTPLNKMSFYIRKVGAPSDLTVRILSDSSGSPSTSNLLSSNGTLSASLVSATTFGWVEVVFSSNISLDPDETYWVVLDGGNNSNKYYQLGANNDGYANGQAKIGAYSGTWNNTTPTGLDGHFNIYLGGLNSSIGGGSYVGAVNIGTAGVGNAWAHTVTGAHVEGSLFCQTGSNNNKACNTSQADPAPVGFPVSDANIQQWKDEASGGWTYNGNLTIGYQGTTTGPMVVNGNLLVNGGGEFLMTGTVWVTGTVTFTGGGYLKLASSYGANSGTLVSDGRMTLNGGSDFGGSGQSTSYPLLITTSNCPAGPTCGGSNAIEISGGSGAVVLNAQQGTLHMTGGTSAKALTANTIVVGGGGEVTYVSGLTNMNFSGGPSGGWVITSWQEVQ